MSYDPKLIKQKSVYLQMEYVTKLERLAAKLKISESKLIGKWVIEKLEELK